MSLNPFRPVIESKRRGGPWLLPGVLVALALAMAVLLLFGALALALLAAS